jgi:mercuric ion binding protein
MKKLTVLLLLMTAILSTPAWAAMQTITLSVSDMTCAACPITVKKALMRVKGVQQTEVSYKKREAVVTFDNATTNVEALLKATRNAGYPSTLKE